MQKANSNTCGRNNNILWSVLFWFGWMCVIWVLVLSTFRERGYRGLSCPISLLEVLSYHESNDVFFLGSFPILEGDRSETDIYNELWVMQQISSRTSSSHHCLFHMLNDVALLGKHSRGVNYIWYVLPFSSMSSFVFSQSLTFAIGCALPLSIYYDLMGKKFS